ncbi:MAG: SDR family oxidoreductase [Pirellulaceae bacterium]|jgi:NAD(P)-dependent dehydrogenase (short-subunit alcohol dehydrogenase family)|nr:SDR family oxidoreductase [Pirellulaceae bacterium]MDP7019632.1 SDR family oxidoreductase [Pirellulaceae bacterium]
MIDLKGHAALITGSTKGVGRSIAESYARAGCHVVIHGRAVGAASEEALQACRSHGVEAHFVTGDLSGPTEAATAEVFDNALAVRPDIDILVNNAGTYIDDPYLELTHDTFEYTMRLNVAAPFFLTQRFAKHWIAAGVDGRVLMIGSINGRLAEEVHACYDTSKGAVEAMIKTLCVSLAPHNVRVNGLAPGLVRTPLTSIIDENEDFADWMELHTPNGKVPHSDVCGGGAVYLVSDDAWHVHGQLLLVDGGMSAWQQPDMPPHWKKR